MKEEAVEAKAGRRGNLKTENKRREKIREDTGYTEEGVTEMEHG